MAHLGLSYDLTSNDTLWPVCFFEFFRVFLFSLPA